MADPLSIGAGVVGIIVPALHGSRLLLDDLQCIINAPKALETLKTNLSSVEMALTSLRAVKDVEWELLGDDVVKHSKAAIHSCTDACELFRIDLQQLTKHSNGGNLSWRDRANVGFLKQRRLKAISDQLQTCQISLNSVASIATLCSSIRSTNITEEIKKAISAKEAELSEALSSTDRQLAEVETSLDKLNFDGASEEQSQHTEDTGNTVKQIEEERNAVELSRKLLEQLLSRAREEAVFKAESEIQSRTTHVTSGSQGKGVPQSAPDITIEDLGSVIQIGISGPIHLPPERRETAPSPSSNVPFLRDPDYIDRQELLERVHTKCSIPASRTALVGLGGVGKSQLAIEFSYQIRDRSPDTWVFWVYAGNGARLEQSYQEIADQAKIAGRKDPKANIFKLVHDWLRDAKNGKWHLILDNVDDDRIFNETPSLSQDGPRDSQINISGQPLLAYLSRIQNGSILITSRSMGVASKLVEQSGIIAVEPMDKANAIKLFEKKLGEIDRTDIAALATALEFMPLAIVQAAAYIAQRTPRYSVQQYLKDFQKSDRKKTSLLNHEGGHLRRDWEAKSSIITTWQISFDYIRQVRPSAADLLSLMSFFDRQGIPDTLVRSIDTEQNDEKVGMTDTDDEEKDEDNDENSNENSNENSTEDSSSESIGDDGFEDDISILRNYSFISANTDTTTFEMHRLVQLATRTWLIVHGQLERWKRQFIKNLVVNFPTGEFETWEECQLLFPHVRAAELQPPDKKDSLQDWALLLYNAAHYAWTKGNIVDAEKMSLKAMNTRAKLFGQEHDETLNAMAMVGLAYSLGGRQKEAEELRLKLMETRKRVSGEENPSTLTSMVNLASTYWSQGRWKEAEDLEVQVIEVEKRVLGAEHMSTLISIDNLASTYSDQGRLKEAEELKMHVMEIRKRVLGAEHPNTLTSMSNLASTYWAQGRWTEAEDLEVLAMEARKRVLGAEHPDTLISMNNLASTYSHQGRLKEAEELKVNVIEVKKRVLGAEHPSTLTSMNNLASTYWAQGKWKEAEDLEVLAMEGRKRVLGAEHPNTLNSMNNLAFTWKDQGRKSQALQLMEECVRLRRQVLSNDHPDTKSSVATLSEWQEE